VEADLVGGEGESSGKVGGSGGAAGMQFVHQSQPNGMSNSA
jgi:hypothetical protein